MWYRQRKKIFLWSIPHKDWSGALHREAKLSAGTWATGRQLVAVQCSKRRHPGGAARNGSRDVRLPCWRFAFGFGLGGAHLGDLGLVGSLASLLVEQSPLLENLGLFFVALSDLLGKLRNARGSPGGHVGVHKDSQS